jgi:hypothetical protein
MNGECRHIRDPNNAQGSGIVSLMSTMVVPQGLTGTAIGWDKQKRIHSVTDT